MCSQYKLEKRGRTFFQIARATRACVSAALRHTHTLLHSSIGLSDHTFERLLRSRSAADIILLAIFFSDVFLQLIRNACDSLDKPAGTNLQLGVSQLVRPVSHCLVL